jgi:hypothetical protein
MIAESQATAKAILTAFKSLPKAERDAVLSGIAGDHALRRDLLDLATIAERRSDPLRPLQDYLAERRRK